jgi:hypothetical protein
MPASKKATVKRAVRKIVIPEPVKKYLTIKNAVILCIVIFGLILLLGGWSIREAKRMNNNYNQLQKEFEQLSREQKEQISKDSIRDDSLYKDYDKKMKDRQGKTTIIYQKAKENAEKINNPDFNNDDIRKGFQSN